ncbi:phasin family protein [Paraburkholderia sp. LEh10]|uniref:phasin family protein n=1 Tax=Paraburkholderia sp. LEh10 TaxID=2821353 RepID=UPI001AE201F8|nr:phasin family protein [Paraburkholderia sp. LEh10]MBP0593362.1 phasin family protein [Paraburkholderia sp. LEh10]
MNIRNSEGVISAWESGAAALYAWANPVAEEMKTFAELNLQTINRLNGEALKSLNAIWSIRSPAQLSAVQWDATNTFISLFADYGSKLGSIASRLNERVQAVGHAQAQKNEILVRSVTEQIQSRSQAAAAVVTSAFGTALATEPDSEALAKQETEEAIAVARTGRAAGARPRKAVVE